MLTSYLGSSGLLPAQEFRGTISGQVMDASGAAIVGATVRAVQRSTNQATERDHQPGWLLRAALPATQRL